MIRRNLTRRQLLSVPLIGAGSAALLSAANGRTSAVQSQETRRLIDAEPPTSEAHRRKALLALPPDSERKIDMVIKDRDDLAILKHLEPFKPGFVVAFEMGGEYLPTSSYDRGNWPWFSARGKQGNPVLFTAVGDRDKPWPLFRDSPGAMGIEKSNWVTWEFAEWTSEKGVDLLRVHRSKNINLRYMLARNHGRGRSPGVKNEGKAFVTSDLPKGATIWLEHLEAWDIAEDLYQDLRGSQRATVHAANIYAHECWEDGIDNKSVGNLIIRNFWAIDCGSKGLLCHGKAGNVDMQGFRIEGCKLHDAIWINPNRGRIRGDSWIFRDGVCTDNKGYGLSVTDVSGHMIIENVDLAGNGRGDFHRGHGTEKLQVDWV